MHSNLKAADVAKYFGCPIIDMTGKVYTNYKIYSNGNIGLALPNYLPTKYDINNQCYLLLKPLSELSKDDAVEVAKIANFNRVEIQLAIGKDIANSIANKIVDRLSSISYIKIIDIIDYLRSKGYDMDGFIEKNKAKHG